MWLWHLLINTLEGQLVRHWEPEGLEQLLLQVEVVLVVEDHLKDSSIFNVCESESVCLSWKCYTLTVAVTPHRLQSRQTQ